MGDRYRVKSIGGNRRLGFGVEILGGGGAYRRFRERDKVIESKKGIQEVRS